MYGFLRGLLPTLDQARHEGRPWVYADRGYFRSTYGNDYSGYFRLTRDAFQHDGRGVYNPQRWKSLGMRVAPWRRGSYILVCPPGDVFTTAIGGFTSQSWIESTVGTLRQHTDREIRVRRKPAKGADVEPLALALWDAHALVTHMSNTAVEAVLEGIPVFCTGRCAGATMGQSDLTKIENPVYPDREDWLAALAANQWTLEELAKGKASHLFHDAT